MLSITNAATPQSDSLWVHLNTTPSPSLHPPSDVVRVTKSRLVCGLALSLIAQRDKKRGFREASLLCYYMFLIY